jgi:hypothetical protein
VFHVALSPDGKLGVAAQLRPKNLIPLAQVEHGSVFANSLTLFGEDVGGTVQVPIDELERYFSLPCDSRHRESGRSGQAPHRSARSR